MMGTSRRLVDRQSALVERLGLGVLALGIVEFRQVVEVIVDIGMVGTQSFLIDRQRPLKKRIGLGVLA